ncbi:MAG: hypothetical protein DWQ53_09710 [Microcystis flos-aquae DF17]|nr:MAG: hypothetical protein DWQ53_09710 [Microcystis flos-aquae DF17]
MTAIAAEAAPSAWSWWEARRLPYNVWLFVAGWVGFALMIVASDGGDVRGLLSVWRYGVSDLLITVGRMGAAYMLYMAAANVMFLAGPILETMLKPESLIAYRRRAWAMGLIVSVGVPLIIALGMGLALWDPGHGG